MWRKCIAFTFTLLVIGVCTICSCSLIVLVTEDEYSYEVTVDNDHIDDNTIHKDIQSDEQVESVHIDDLVDCGIYCYLDLSVDVFFENGTCKENFK